MQATLERIIEARRNDHRAQLLGSGFPSILVERMLPSRDRLERDVLTTAYHEASHALLALLSSVHELQWLDIEVTDTRNGHTRYGRKKGTPQLGPGHFDEQVFGAFVSKPARFKDAAYRTCMNEVAVLMVGPIVNWKRDYPSVPFDEMNLIDQNLNDTLEALTWLRPMQSDEGRCWGRMLAVASQILPFLDDPAVESAMERIKEGLVEKGRLSLSDVKALIPAPERARMSGQMDSALSKFGTSFQDPKEWESVSTEMMEEMIIPRFEELQRRRDFAVAAIKDAAGREE